ncbi:uncharacterized protein with FMN-binding domain [Cryobacterium sp. MP_3.1]|uniref:FMN-binding protein n=1 Tax=Cryobacterium sp. MP_3.1 TaxID=3071711 RepID=UPI002DF975AA|nr:uncharacterized protein with FMN-binding domain [Cryobacterium sp. MP_3.1]
MRGRAIALSILSCSTVLAVGWQLGVAGQPQPLTRPTDAAAQAPDTGAGSTAPGGSASTPAPSAGTTAPSAAGASGTFTGTAAQTRFGDVQVQITVAGGTITDVAALQLTDHDRKSVQISNRAAPMLRQEVLSAQTANVQNVSGATYTSDAYLTSLQSAIDQAGL